MKKFIKNNLKTILAVSATAIICISGTAFAAYYQYNAKQVEYKDGKSVEIALNELYEKNSNLFNKTNWEIKKDQLLDVRKKGNKASITLEPGKYILFTTLTSGTHSTTSRSSFSISGTGLTIPSENGTIELIDYFTGSKDGTELIESRYHGFSITNRIYTVHLTETTTLTEEYPSNDISSKYAQIITMRSIKIE